MEIIVFHYHLKPSEMRNVIVHSIRSILNHVKKVSEIRLVTGMQEGTYEVMERIQSGFDINTASKIKLDILKEIAPSKNPSDADVQKIIERLEARYDENSLWWIHNYHLGENSSFTAALMKIAEQGNVNMLFHIHEFPECGRMKDLQNLNNILREPPYPSGSRIRYAVVNERDYSILRDTGLGDSVELLLNPPPTPPSEKSSPEELREALVETCSVSNPGFLPEAPILFYPVHTLHRKNVLEAGIIARLITPPSNVLLSLVRDSQDNTTHSDIVQKAFKDGLIPGVWRPEATGDPRLSFGKLAGGCSGIISTSVQENFGYLFLDALYWRKPLLARYLDVANNLLDIFNEYPRRFWADLRVPVDKETIERTKIAYLEKLKTFEPFILEKSQKSIRSAIDKIALGDSIELSLLSIPDQLNILDKAQNDEKWIEKAKILNKVLLESISQTLRAKPLDLRLSLNDRFNPITFVRSFSKIVSSFGRKSPSVSPRKIQDTVSKAFGRIDCLRLIYDSPEEDV